MKTNTAILRSKSKYRFLQLAILCGIIGIIGWLTACSGGDDLIDISTGYTISLSSTTVTAGVASVLEPTVAKASSTALSAADDYTLTIKTRPSGASTEALTINAEGKIAVADSVGSGDAGDYTLAAQGKNAYTGTLEHTFTLVVNPATSNSVTIKEGGQNAANSISKEYGAELALTADVTIAGGATDTVNWASSTPSVATIQPDATGNGATITAVGLGDTTITATSTADSGVKDTIDLTVTAKAISQANLSYDSLTVTAGATSGNTVSPTLDSSFLVSGDALPDAVNFTIAKVSGTGPEPGTSITVGDTGILTIASTQAAFTATQYRITMAGKGNYSGQSESEITLVVNAAMEGYGTPAIITEVENENSNFSFSWDEFDNDDSTVYAVYAYNLTIRTATGGTAPDLTTFLAGKSSVTDVIQDMAPLESCSQLTDPNTPASTLVNALYLFPQHKYVFVVTGTRGGSVLPNTIAAGIIDIAAVTGSPGYVVVKASADSTQFYAAIVDDHYMAWADAAKAAKAQGGGATLAEIGSAAEQTLAQDAIDLLPAASIAILEVIPDGGNGKYLWIGATDKTTEGTWVWDGNNDGTTTPLGTATTSFNSLTAWAPATGAYENWGKAGGAQREPDDSSSIQDYAAISVTGWPNGAKYQWNDIGTKGVQLIAIQLKGNNGYLLEAEKHWD